VVEKVEQGKKEEKDCDRRDTNTMGERAGGKARDEDHPLPDNLP
jgi:hypothetical protein